MSTLRRRTIGRRELVVTRPAYVVPPHGDISHELSAGEGDEPYDRAVELALLTATEPGRRNRRTTDSVFLGWAAIVIGLSAAVASSAPQHDRDVAEALTTVFGWAGALWRTAFVGLLVFALLIVLEVLLRRRWDLARDLLLAALVLLAMGMVLGRLVESDWFPAKSHLLSRWGYPELRLAAGTVVVVVVGPELVRGARLFAIWLASFATLGAVVLGAALPASALGALALGLGAGALVRLVFGTAAGVPPTRRVRAALHALGVEVNDLAPSPRQHVGAAEYVGHDVEGRPLKTRVLDKDAQDTQRLARRWRLLAYRDPPRSAPIGRLEQVEHEALATLMAAQAGVRVPEVVFAALGPDGDAVIVTRQPDVEPLESASADQVSDATLDDLWQQVRRLQDAGISHGRLNLSNVLDLDGGPMLVDFSAATLGAPQSALDIDVAELLVACTVLVGPQRALSKAVEAGWGQAIARALPYLQRAALTPHLRDLSRTHEVGLKELRAAAADATGQAVPDLVPLRRVRLRDVLLTVMLGVAAYLLITRLAQIGFGTIADALREASIPWVILGLILSQLALVTSGVSLRGAVATPLPLLPCVVLQSAKKFVSLTVPGSAGLIALNVRFLQKMGAPTGEAVAAGAIDDLSEKIIELLLVAALLPFVHLDLHTGKGGGGVPSGRIVGVVVLALVAVVAVVMAVPALRAKIVPSVRGGLSSLWVVARDRGKRMELFGGNLGSEVLFALTLGAVAQAYGVDLTLLQLLVINLTAGLVAVGVDDSTAFAIALTHRLCTSYLPPIWGYAALRWLGRKGYV
jgi:tRNA A-37 threonylcarbamoyl transferase component Bud32